MKFPLAPLMIPLVTAAFSAEPFGHIVKVVEGPAPSFESATFSVFPDQAGGHLRGLMDLPARSTAAGAVFDGSADLLWAAYLDLPATVPADQTVMLGPVPDDPSKVGGVYIPEPGKVRFGVADGATLVQDFAFEYDFGSKADTVGYVSSRSIQQFAFTIDEGSSVSLFTVDPAGLKIIDKTYLAASFGPGATQFVDPIVNNAGVVTHLHVRNDAGITHTRTLIRLSESGEVSWAKQVQFDGFVFPFPYYPFTAPDESFIINFPTFSGHTFIKINPDGSFGWARTLDGFFTPAPVFSSDGETVWFSALTSLSLPEINHYLVAGFDLDTGGLVASFEPGPGYDNLGVFRATGDRVYFRLRRNPCEWVVGWVAPDLSSVTASERTDVLGTFAVTCRNETTLATSQFDAATRRVLMVGLDGNLQAGDGQCPDFSPIDIQFVQPDINPVPFTPTISDVVVTAIDAATPLTATTLPFAALPLEIQPCDYAAFIPDKAPRLSPSFDEEGGFAIRFPSLKNRIYELLRIGDFSEEPDMVEALQGSGATSAFQIIDTSSPAAFFVIRHYPVPLE